ncbi:hypothetical protein MMC25_007583 [Agyrium rufum]|nr:hypothetical protein [Agyrium rufum]
MALSPFPAASNTPGEGSIEISFLPPSRPTISEVSFTYPLKLVVSTPHIISSPPNPQPDEPHYPKLCPLIFLLSYGGGLLPPDTLSLKINLAPYTRLCLTTQGHTKLFAPPPSDPNALSRQILHTTVGRNAAFWLAPDPTQPFAGTCYSQKQVFYLGQNASVGFIDWVCEGRKARGESWNTIVDWRGINEIWTTVRGQEDTRPRLIIRDSVVLHPTDSHLSMSTIGIFATLILHGPLFVTLGAFLITEFKQLPRIGAPQDWANSAGALMSELSAWRQRRWEQERLDGVLWTAAPSRNCVILKLVAKDVEGAKWFLREMLGKEGTIDKEFGPGGSMCFR